MDPRLAEIYGTNEDVSDIEKTAAAELAEKLAEDGTTNIDGMSDDEIEALAQEVLSADGQEGAAEEETEETEKVAADKVAEADFLGRVMAHAYVNELKAIDKEASVEKTATDGKVLKKIAAMPPQFMKKNEEKKEGKEEEKKEKKSSALDTLATQRALEILQENGIELQQQEQGEEKQASKADLLAQAVEARAVELLKAEGFSFEE